MLPSTMKYLYSVEPVRMHFPTNGHVQMILCAMLHMQHCTQYQQHCTQYHLYTAVRGKMHSDWFNRIEILQSRWQHGEKVGYCYPSGLERTLCKWDKYVPLVTKGLILVCCRKNNTFWRYLAIFWHLMSCSHVEGSSFLKTLVQIYQTIGITSHKTITTKITKSHNVLCREHTQRNFSGKIGLKHFFHWHLLFPLVWVQHASLLSSYSYVPSD